MRKEQRMVEEFHRAFAHPIVTQPTLMSPERVNDRARWLDEEVREFRSAPNLVEQADAMVDLIYFALGTLVEMGVDGEAIFHIVQEANMRKLWPDGKPRFGKDGKVMKPATWVNPHELIAAEVERQVKDADVEARRGMAQTA